MPWNIRGQNLEHCNCNSVCPCYTSLFARPGDFERCQGFIAFNVESGQADGIDLSGRRAIFVQDAPGRMADGNWKVGVIVDSEANDEQAERLAAIITGNAGGPMAGFAPLIGEFVGMERAPIEFVQNGHQHSLRAGALIDAEFQDEVHDGQTDPVQITNVSVPFGPPTNVSPPTKSLIRAFGLDIDNSGRHGTSSTFDWTG